MDVGCWKLDAGCWMPDAGCWMLDVGHWMLDTVSISSNAIFEFTLKSMNIKFSHGNTDFIGLILSII
jgi:hypothetical protein